MFFPESYTIPTTHAITHAGLAGSVLTTLTIPATNMISFTTIALFGFCHWLFDFFLQTDEQSKGKSHSFYFLGQHVGVYMLGLFVMASFTPAINSSPRIFFAWAVFNTMAHFFTDYITSRASSLLWKDGNVHDFFVTVGIDQYIHYFTLFGSLAYILNK